VCGVDAGGTRCAASVRGKSDSVRRGACCVRENICFIATPLAVMAWQPGEKRKNMLQKNL